MEQESFLDRWLLPLGVIIVLVISIGVSGIWKWVLPNQEESAQSVIEREIGDDSEQEGASSDEQRSGAMTISNESVTIIKETSKGYRVTIKGTLLNDTDTTYLSLAEVVYGLYDESSNLIVSPSGNLDDDIEPGGSGTFTVQVMLSTSEYEKFAFFRILTVRGTEFSTDAPLSEVISLVSEAKSNRG